MRTIKRRVLWFVLVFGLFLAVLGQRIAMNAKRNQNTLRLGEVVKSGEKADESQVRLLLQGGAEPNAPIDPPRIPLYVALLTALHINRPHPHSMTIFMYAANAGNERVLRMLLEAGGDVRDRDESGRTAFAYAMGIRKPNAELLIRAGSDVNHSGINFLPLTLAIQHPTDMAFFSLLLAHGADPNGRGTQEMKGVTPLMWDAYSECPSCVLALLQAGADINACDPDGSTALMWAAKDGSPQSLTVLLKSGADTTLRDKKGQTAEMIAARSGQRQALRLIRLYGSRRGPR